MSRWLQLARAVDRSQDPVAKIAEIAKSPEQTSNTHNFGNFGKGSASRSEGAQRPIAGLDHLTADEREERAAIAEHDGGLPREWAEGLATLSTMATPPDIPEGRWSRIIDNAARFADRWGRQAVDLGWSVRDVFGCHPTRPWKRIDQAGLVWLIGDHEVVAITADTAVLMTPCGNRQTYYRRGQAGQTLIWQLGDQEPPCRRR